VVRLSITNTYIQRKNTIIEQTDQIKQQRRKMQSSLLERKKVDRVITAVKQVPAVSQSSKYLQAEKKTLVLIVDGEEITMEEM
jgi:uncharacterized protein (DUF1499 family)